MRALVTGASGFVGAAVARALLQEGWQVRALVRPASDRTNLRTCRSEIARGRSDGRGHSAGRRWPDVKPCSTSRRTTDWARRTRAAVSHQRRRDAATLMTAAGRRGSRIVYTSSVATMGIPADGTPGDEGTPVHRSPQ